MTFLFSKSTAKAVVSGGESGWAPADPCDPAQEKEEDIDDGWMGVTSDLPKWRGVFPKVKGMDREVDSWGVMASRPAKLSFY